MTNNMTLMKIRDNFNLIMYPIIMIFITFILKATPLTGFFSGHALILSSLIIIIGLKKGIKSPVFAVVFTLSALYLYDMIRLHKIIAFGHTVVEILIGIIAGIVLTSLIYYFVERKWIQKL